MAYAKVIDEPEVRRSGLNATLNILKIKKGDGWQKCHGKVQGIFEPTESIAYGDVLKIEGAVLKFDDADLFGFYRKIYGIRRKLIAIKVEKEGNDASTAMRLIYTLKQKASNSLVADFKDKECASLYQAMILGMRSEMPSWSRNLFVRSSSIHLFSISGLHILFFSRFLEWLLSTFGIPRKHRLLMLMPCMLIYVTMSGAAPSALRSYYMMLAMTLAYFRYRQHSIENGLGLSGLLLLLLNPFYMMHIGFLYSFILVFCLLRGRIIIRAALEVLTERQKLIPSKHRSIVSRMIIRPIFTLVSGGTIAWFGSVGIMMRSSCFIAFGAVIVNILLAPLASMLVFLAIPKAIAALFSEGLSSILAACVETLLKTLIITSKAGGSGFLCVACPRIALPVLLAYYLLLTIALSGIRPFGARVISLLTLCAIILTALPNKWPQPCLLATTGQSGLPPCLAIIDSRHSTTIIQLGDAPSSRRMINKLKEIGCADRIYIRIRSKQEIRGAMQFPEESIMAILIESRAFDGIISSPNYITQAIAHGTHLVPNGNEMLNGIKFKQSNERLNVSFPDGELCVINNDTGITQVTTSDGRTMEICPRLTAESLEAIIVGRLR